MSEPRQLQIQVEGLQNLSETLEEHKGKQIVVMFIGSMLRKAIISGKVGAQTAEMVSTVHN